MLLGERLAAMGPLGTTVPPTITGWGNHNASTWQGGTLKTLKYCSPFNDQNFCWSVDSFDVLGVAFLWSPPCLEGFLGTLCTCWLLSMPGDSIEPPWATGGLRSWPYPAPFSPCLSLEARKCWLKAGPSVSRLGQSFLCGLLRCYLCSFRNASGPQLGSPAMPWDLIVAKL